MYHYNFKTGKIGICHAKSPSDCPFGSDNHAETLEEVQIKADVFNKEIVKFCKELNMNEKDVKNFIYKTNKARIDKDKPYENKPKKPRLNKSKLSDLSELAMMGKYVAIEKENNHEQVNFITDYILKTNDKEDNYKNIDIYKDRINQYSEHIVTHIGVNTINGGERVISYVIEPVNNEEDIPPNFTEDYGDLKLTFCYTLNLDYDLNSEFGNCYFELRQDGFYHRKY